MGSGDADGLRRGAGFMGVPWVSQPGDALAFVLGVPFDCGMHPSRVGARQGPAHIRAQSSLIRRYHPEHEDIDPCTALNLVDCGDIDVVPSQIEPSFEKIEAVLSRLTQDGVIAYTLGGDGAVTLPQLRSLAKRYADLVVVHFDAHTDTTPPPAPGVHNTGTQFHYAAVEQLIDTASSFHIGMRGTLPFRDTFTHSRRLGYNIVSQDDLLARGFRDVMAEVSAIIRNRPVYLCWDMDILDPSCAPGVAAPSWGGLSAREAITLIRMLEGLNLVHVDLNTVSPPHDPTGMTGSLAAALLYELLMVKARAI